MSEGKQGILGRDTSVKDEAVDFLFEELFFSRTDERGIICSGNDVFQRISLYTWDELLNKPHNVIRHPDMPKAVFWLLWETIKQGNPIGAYVKNRAKDGRYYWVFAIVTPVEGGYLSVRLKPSSDIFKLVEEEYKFLLTEEQKQGLAPSESGALLLGRLQELGFPEYKDFMAVALKHEMCARDKELGRTENKHLHIFETLMQLSTELKTQSEKIFTAYSSNEYVPLNLRIQAAQLGEFGKTIDVISNNYNVISADIKNSVDGFTSAVKRVSDTIADGMFLMAVSDVQKEVSELFQDEAEGSDESYKQEEDLLVEQQKAYTDKALEGLINIIAEVEAFHESCLDMKRLISGLEVTRIMGKVESARLLVSKAGLNELVSELDAFQKTVADCLKEIESINQKVQTSIQQLRRSLK